MRTIIAAAIIALLTMGAQAQDTDMRKGKAHRQDERKTEDLSKKKADEKAYRDALKKIPESKEKLDPWKTLR